MILNLVVADEPRAMALSGARPGAGLHRYGSIPISTRNLYQCGCLRVINFVRRRKIRVQAARRSGGRCCCVIAVRWGRAAGGGRVPTVSHAS